MVEDDAIVGERIVDAQVVAVGDELAVTVNAEVGDVVGSKTGAAVEGGGEGVDAEADVVGGAAGVDDGALAGGEGLVEGEAGEGVAEANERGRENVACRAVGWKIVPLGEDASDEEGDEGGMKDEGGEGGPGIFIGVQIGDGFMIGIFGTGIRAGASPVRALYDNGTDAIVAFAQLAVSKGHGVGVGAGDAFESVLVEFVAAADDGLAEVLPDGGSAVESADDDAGGKDGEYEKKVPAREDGKELEGVEDGGEGAVAR